MADDLCWASEYQVGSRHPVRGTGTIGPRCPEAVPEQNLAILQSLRGGRIEPGRQYILWFATPNGEPGEVDLAVRFVPQGDLPESRNARDLAQALGLTLPQTPSEQRVRATLAYCRTLQDERGPGSELFRKTLGSVVNGLPDLRVSTGSDPPEWDEVTLNANGTLAIAPHIAGFYAPLMRTPPPVRGPTGPHGEGDRPNGGPGASF